MGSAPRVLRGAPSKQRVVAWLAVCLLSLVGCSADTDGSAALDQGRHAQFDAGGVGDFGTYGADAADLGGASADNDAVDAGAPDLPLDPAELGSRVEPACPSVAIEAPPASLGLDPYYTRYVDAGGIPIVGSARVPDDAFRVAYYVVASLLDGRPCEHLALVESGVRVGLVAASERITELPEYRDFYSAFPGTDWDQRGRGYGATVVRPVTSGAEENLLRYAEDPWVGENILVHELAHTLLEFGILAVAGGADFGVRVETAFQEARANGLWQDTYAATNAAEYWAEGVQSWFGVNREAVPADGIHNYVDRREELAQHDPRLSILVGERVSAPHWSGYCDPSADEPEWPVVLERPDPDACTLRYAYPDALPCSALSGLRSRSDEVEVLATFVNRGYEDLAIGWLDYDGREVGMGILGARSEFSTVSYASHPFVARDADGRCLGVHVAEPEVSFFVYE